MARKSFTSEQIIGKLREAEIRLGQGETLPDVCRALTISEHNFYRWREEFGGLNLSQAQRLKGLERETSCFGAWSPISRLPTNCSKINLAKWLSNRPSCCGNRANPQASTASIAAGRRLRNCAVARVRACKIPFRFPQLCMDIKQWAIELGDPELPRQVGVRHHALADARWTRDAWAYLASLHPAGAERCCVGSKYHDHTAKSA